MLKTLNYRTLKNPDEISNLSSELIRNKEFVVDLETTGLDTHAPDLEIVGAGFCFKEEEAYYIPMFDGDVNHTQRNLDILRDCLEDDSLLKIGHNIKYDCRVLRRYGVNVKGIYFDTMLASYCLNCDKTAHNLDDLTLNAFGHIKIRTKSVIPKSLPGPKVRKKKGEPAPVKRKPSMKDAPMEQVAIYCMEDVDYTFRLYKYFSYLLNLPANADGKKIFWDIEMPILPIIIDMECSGVHIDTSVLDKLKEQIIKSSTEIKKQISEAVGWEPVLTKPDDIAKIIYDDLKLYEKKNLPIKFTKTRKRATTAKALALIADHPVVQNIQMIKGNNKLISTYVNGIPKKISPIDNKVHASFNQHITSTGRLSSSEPNLQNIPARTEIGKTIRGAFVSRFDGGKILSADYSQQEMRILAHVSGETLLIEAFLNGEDPHTNVASQLFSTPKDQVQKPQRDKCKTINYGIIYGMQADKLASELTVSRDEAEHLLWQYRSKMTHVDAYIKDTENFLRKNGYTKTMYGRKRYLPDIFSYMKFLKLAALREGVNHTIQGSGADQVKMAMRKVRSKLDDMQALSILILQVHDEIVIDVHPTELKVIKDPIVKIMQEVDKLAVPIVADAHFGASWRDAH